VIASMWTTQRSTKRHVKAQFDLAWFVVVVREVGEKLQ
jgi:hypothetical protein